jgi:hypothetical protein
MSRLFTFGCSFTRYHLPTWADILGREFDYYENWGRPAAGNQYIFNSLVECNQRNNFTSKDTIIIMWSTFLREDRYTKESDGWICSGNIITSSLYDNKFKKKFVCERGFFIRDIALIAAAQNLLKLWNTDFKILSLLPITGDPDITELFKSNLDDIISFLPTIDIQDNRSESDWSFFDETITPNKFLLNELKENYNDCKGVDWPEFKKFLNFKKENIEHHILADMSKYSMFSKLKRITLKYADHPTPKEHLSFVQQVFQNYNLTSTTIDWINNYQINDTFDAHLPSKRL